MKELEEQLGARPRQEELELARAALAAAEEGRQELRAQLQEARGRLAELEAAGGCLAPTPGLGASAHWREPAPARAPPPHTPPSPKCGPTAARSQQEKQDGDLARSEPAPPPPPPPLPPPAPAVPVE